MFSRLKILKKYFPLTLSGIIVLLFVDYFLLILAFKRSDIIANVIGIALTTLVVLLLILCFLSRKVLAQRASVAIFPLNASEAVAGSPVKVSVKLSGVKLPPLFRLKAELNFSGQSEVFLEVVSSSFSNNQSVKGSITFPHRGVWYLTGINWQISDLLGLTSLGWKSQAEEHRQSIRVEPGGYNQSGVPLITSSYREGDALSQPMEHSGDYYDIKRYHPSDGMNKLLWKLFAKSGDLLARRPEESVSPEGQTVVYAIARRSDDPLASAIVKYLQYAESADSDVIASCLGAGDLMPARSSEKMHELFIDSVFNVPQKINNSFVKQDFTSFIDQVSSILEFSKLANIAFFVSEDFLHNSLYAGYCKWLGEFVSNRGAEPIFCILKNESKQSSHIKTIKFGPKPQKILDWLVEQPPALNSSLVTHKNYLLSICQQRGWKLFEGSVF